MKAIRGATENLFCTGTRKEALAGNVTFCEAYCRQLPVVSDLGNVTRQKTVSPRVLNSSSGGSVLLSFCTVPVFFLFVPSNFHDSTRAYARQGRDVVNDDDDDDEYIRE